MCAFFPGNVYHHRATLETVFKLDIPAILSHPRGDSKDNLYVCSQQGEIIKFQENGNPTTLLSFSGQPSCVTFLDLDEASFMELMKSKKDGDQSNSNESKSRPLEEEQKELFIFSDLANSIIYYVKPNGEKEYIAKDYLGCPLKGPTSMAAMSTSDAGSCIFFCDGGYFESTSISRPNGSVYSVTLSSPQNLIQPILSNCLAYPADIYYDENMLVGYIAETFNNRILRFIETAGDNECIYQTSVFYTFQGRVGPTALTCDDLGNIYVARYEYQNKEGEIDGIIDVINKDGILIGELVVPKMPEITGLYIPKKEEFKDNRSKMYLYFTEKNFSGVQRIKIGTFINELDKILDKMY